jgi:hypothetical protein
MPADHPAKVVAAPRPNASRAGTLWQSVAVCGLLGLLAGAAAGAVGGIGSSVAVPGRDVVIAGPLVYGAVGAGIGVLIGYLVGLLGGLVLPVSRGDAALRAMAVSSMLCLVGGAAALALAFIGTSVALPDLGLVVPGPLLAGAAGAGVGAATGYCLGFFLDLSRT